MIGELFAFFDIDCDRYWNFKEDDVSWSQLLHMVPPEFVDRGKKAISLEGFVWLYLNPDFGFNIDKDYMTVFTKVKMAQQVFDFFDYDKDGYWNSRESRECQKITEPDEHHGAREESEKAFWWLVREVMPENEQSKGLSRKAIVNLFCQPMYSHFEMNIARDHDKTQEYKAMPPGHLGDRGHDGGHVHDHGGRVAN
eukprot:Skav235203  [mRNA]  locus=scaffold4495:41323:48701:- [translate_table: standard]